MLTAASRTLPGNSKSSLVQLRCLRRSTYTEFLVARIPNCRDIREESDRPGLTPIEAAIASDLSADRSIELGQSVTSANALNLWSFAYLLSQHSHTHYIEEKPPILYLLLQNQVTT